MSTGENRKRTQELRRIGFQKLLAGIVLIFGVGVLYFIFLDEDDGLRSHSNSSGRGLGIVLLCGVFGLWNVVRGAIYLVRAQSGDEQYAKGVEDALDKIESKQAEMMTRKVGNASTHNVLVLLVWVFLVLAVVGAIVVGYLIWTRPR